MVTAHTDADHPREAAKGHGSLAVGWAAASDYIASATALAGLRFRRSIVAAATLALVALHPGAGAAQRLDAARVVQDYLAAADAYAAGEVEAAVEQAVSWDSERVDLAVEALTRRPDALDNRRAAAAMMLHAEAVISQAVMPSRFDAHLRAARRLAATPAATRLPQTFRRDWLLAMTWHLLSELEFARAVPWVADLLGLAPDDPEGLATLATFAEVYAWTPEPPAPLPWEHPLLRQMGGPNRTRLLDFAVRTYRRALDAAPSDLVQLRLGRTLLAADRLGEALPMLQRLRDTAGDRDARYLASLFLAAADQQRTRYGDAAAAYESAIALKPGCPTPIVGLGAVLALQGRTADAARVASRLDAAATKPCDDPWWGYRFGPPIAQRAQVLLRLRDRAVTR